MGKLIVCPKDGKNDCLYKMSETCLFKCFRDTRYGDNDEQFIWCITLLRLANYGKIVAGMLCSNGGGEEAVGVACSPEGGVSSGADAWWALGAAAPVSSSVLTGDLPGAPGPPSVLTSTDWREDMAFTAFELDPLPPLFSPPPLQPYR